MFKRLQSSPIFSRVVPFAVFALLTLLQGQLGENSQYWMYALKTGVGAWLLWIVRPYVKEMRWKFSWEALVVGVFVFVLWVGLDGFYPPIPLIGERTVNFDPNSAYGTGSILALFFITVRVVGSSLVVPPLEEVFYRSFIYRYIQKSDFLKIPLGRFHWFSFLVTGIIFGAGHYEWLPGILCAFAYQGLVCRKNRLGDAICAHAITNFLLALWVLARGAYIFW
jgi:CAAX prenyl protease-like protein